jgi:hypothetical protein
MPASWIAELCEQYAVADEAERERLLAVHADGIAALSESEREAFFARLQDS